MNMMNDPRLRTDSYAKIFLYNTHETVACVPRHTIRMTVSYTHLTLPTIA